MSPSERAALWHGQDHARFDRNARNPYPFFSRRWWLYRRGRAKQSALTDLTQRRA